PSAWRMAWRRRGCSCLLLRAREAALVISGVQARGDDERGAGIDFRTWRFAEYDEADHARPQEFSVMDGCELLCFSARVSLRHQIHEHGRKRAHQQEERPIA